MNTPKVAAAILGIGVAAAGVTFYVSKDKEPAPLETVAATPAKSTAGAPVSVNASPSKSTQTSTGGPGNSGSSKSTGVSETAPEGIDQALWDRTRNQVKMIYGMSQQMRNNGFMQQMLDARVKSDAESISTQLGLQGETSEAMEALLKERSDGTMQQATKVWDAMLADEGRLTEMMALQETKEKNGELSPELKERQDALRKEAFGQFIDKDGPLTDEDVQKLFGSQRPEEWYKDDAFIVKAAGELPEKDGSSLIEYAGKLDYLDREQDANRKVNNIQRTTNLTDQQSDQLKKLYIETPNPSDDQLKAIVPADQLPAIKNANTNRRWGGWR